MDCFAKARRAMILSQLRPMGVTDPAVLGAMGAIPREDFVPESARAIAYAEAPVDLGGGRALNLSAATAHLFAALGIVPGERLLVVGIASGYALAVARRLTSRAVGVESDPALLAAARKHFDGGVIAGPLEDGAGSGQGAAQAPFDAIMIDGAVATLPQALVDQLSEGGRVATGVIDHGVSRLAYGVKAGGRVRLVPFADCVAVPLPGFAVPRQFSF